MQIIRTEIAEATALSGEPILRVLFCGEGGDCVTVDMASVEAGSDDAALDRARAILVQTATFGLAANDYEAESNGNFDECAVTAANDENGGVYVFEYRDGEGGSSVANAQPEGAARGSDSLRDRSPGRDAAGYGQSHRLAGAHAR